MRNITFRKSIGLVLAAFFLACLAAILIQLNAARPVSIIKALNLQRGLSQPPKSITFNANFFGCLTLAEAELRYGQEEPYQGKTAYHLEAEARTIKLISRLYQVQVKVDSLIDKNKLHSLRFTQILVATDKPQDERIVFYDQENNIMELRGVQRNILPDTQDPLSAMYYLQNQDLVLGKEFDINVNTNQKNYRLYMKVIRREEYNIGARKVGAWVLQGDIKRRDKSPRHSSVLTFWVLDGPYKVPFLVKVTTSVGPITARLIKIQ